MKTFKIFSTAALALMMAACSSEDTAQSNYPAQQGQKVPFSATIAAPGSGAGTRTEYTEVTTGDAAGTINVAWKVGDEIALIHNGTKDEVKVETVNEDGSATITGDITVGTNGEAVTAYYPAAAIELNSDKKPVPAEAYTANLLAQDGTLSYIASNLDLRSGESTIAVDGDKATLSDNVKLASQIAIWKLTLQDDAETPAALSATQVSVKVDGETPVTIASTEKLSTATSTVYLAMDAITNETLTIEATVGEGTYSYTNEDISLALGQYYQSTVTMAPAAWAANEYNLGEWNGTKVVFTKKTAEANPKVVEANTMSPTSWSSGWYTVSGDVTITGDVILQTDVHLILQDGAKLTINGQLYCSGNKLYIYGQAEGDGKLNVIIPSGNAIVGDGSLIEVHGGVITVEATNNEDYGIRFEDLTGSIKMYGGKLTATSAGIGINSKDINVYGGNLTATSTKDGGIRFSNYFRVYGGEVEAISNASSGKHGIFGRLGPGNGEFLVVYGGKVSGTGSETAGSGFYCDVQSGTSGIKFYSSDNGTWGDGIIYYGYAHAITSDEAKRYYKAE